MNGHWQQEKETPFWALGRVEDKGAELSWGLERELGGV